MTNFLILVKNELRAIFSIRDRSAGAVAKRTLMILGIVILGLYFEAMLGIMSYFLAESFLITGTLPLLLNFAITAGSIMVLVLCLYKMPAYLFSFADYEMLVALPIRRSTILSAKLFSLYASNLGFSTLIALPMLVLYGVFSGAGAGYYFAAALLQLALPILPMAVGGIVAFLLGKLSSLTRMKNLVMIVGTVITMILAFSFSFAFQPENASQMAGAMTGFLETAAQINFVTPWYVAALSQGEALSGLLYFVVEIGIGALLIAVFAAGYASLRAGLSERQKKSRVNYRTLRIRPLGRALYHKDLKSVFSSGMIAMNTCMGVVIMTAMTVMLSVQFLSDPAIMSDGDTASAFRMVVLPLFTAIYCLFLALTNTAAPSLSLEAKQIWLLRSLPLRAGAIFRSKIAVNLTVSLPLLLVNLIAVWILFSADVLTAAGMLLCTLAFAVFVPLFGLLMNLKMPKLEWKNPLTVVKQSSSVVVSMLVGMALVGLLVLGYVVTGAALFLSSGVYMLLVAALLAVADIALALVLVKRGEALFSAMTEGKRAVSGQTEIMKLR